MGTSGTESCGGCLQTQFKHQPPQLALKLSPDRLLAKSLLCAYLHGNIVGMIL